MAMNPTGPLNAVEFAAVCTALNETLTGAHLEQLRFNSPPVSHPSVRSLIQRADTSDTVLVKYRYRPAVSVISDLVEGVRMSLGRHRVNGTVRDELWVAAVEVLDRSA